MMFLKNMMSAVRTLLGKKKAEKELSDELQFHLECKIEENLKAGMSPEEARRQALLTFGGMDPIKEACRDQWAFRWMEDLAKDILFAWRLLVKSPVFSLVVIITLALGIGANTAIFRLVDTVLLKSLPVKEPDRLVELVSFDPEGQHSWFSYPAFEQFRDRNRVFSGIFAVHDTGKLKVRVDGHLEEARGQMVSGDFFPILGLKVVEGRMLNAEDNLKPGGHPVSVISYGYWSRRFGLDPFIIGKTIFVSNAPFTVVGVAPPEFFGVLVGHSPDLYLPLMMQPVIQKSESILHKPNYYWVQVMARLKPGMNRQQARANVEPIFRDLIMSGVNKSSLSQYEMERIQAHRLDVVPAANGLSDLRRKFSEPLRILMTAAGLALLIACANVATLLLARATARQKEMAVRLSLGAGRNRLIRQLLTESVLLAVLGGTLGVLLLRWTSTSLVSFLSTRQDPIQLDLCPDFQVWGFTALVSLLTGILFGLAPAFRATGVDLTPSLKSEGRSLGRGGSRLSLGKVLIVVQVALSLLLLMVAGLFVRTLRNLKTRDVGFQYRSVLFFSLDLSDANYSGPRRANLDREVIEEIRAMPGVYSASLCWMTPISGGVGTSSVRAEGYVPRADEDMTMYMNTVGSGFFETLGTPLLLGRDFSRQDTVRSPQVALINETMARDFFLNQNPIGKRFGPGWDDSKGQGGYTIIGVVKDAKYVTLRERIHRTAYVYCLQNPEYLLGMTFAVRAQGSPMALIPQIRAILQRIDRSLPEPTFWSFSQQIDESLRQERLLATLSSCFGLLALVLSSIGLFGLFSYAVTRRTPEIGIRMAIGAPPGSIRWMILRETLWLLLAGLAIGLPATLAASRVVSSILFGVAPNDPVTLAATMMLLAGVAIFTGYWPARKASKVDPMVALHYE